MPRLNIEKQKQLEPVRIDYARKKITDLGYEIIKENNTTLQFMYNGSIITLYPYSGWHTGKTIKDGRGLNKLLKQIREGESNLGML